MKRREFLRTLAASRALRPFTVFARTTKRPLIACLVGDQRSRPSDTSAAFSQGMRESGLRGSRDDGFRSDSDRRRKGKHHPGAGRGAHPSQARRLRVGQIAGTIAAKKLTDTIPIVSQALLDPVAFGWAASHARPGGNVTGVLLTVEDLPGKQLALAVKCIPGVSKIGLRSIPAIVTSVSSTRFWRSQPRRSGRVGCVGGTLARRSPRAFPSFARARVKVVLRPRRCDVPQRAQTNGVVGDAARNADFRRSQAAKMSKTVD